MADEVIDTERVDVVADAPTGRALITVDDRAQNCIVVVPGANAEVTGDHIPPSKVVLAQLEVPLAAVTQAFRAARSAGSLTVLNPAPAAPLPDELLRLTDIIVPNEHEVELLGGAAALRERGVDVVVVTRGAAGVTVLERDTAWNRPALSVTAVDTTAAGDAFCGVLAARLAAGAPWPPRSSGRPPVARTPRPSPGRRRRCRRRQVGRCSSPVADRSMTARCTARRRRVVGPSTVNAGPGQRWPVTAAQPPDVSVRIGCIGASASSTWS